MIFHKYLWTVILMVISPWLDVRRANDGDFWNQLTLLSIIMFPIQRKTSVIYFDILSDLYSENLHKETPLKFNFLKFVCLMKKDKIWFRFVWSSLITFYVFY